MNLQLIFKNNTFSNNNNFSIIISQTALCKVMKLILVFTRTFIFINFTFVELKILMPVWNIISASKGDYPSIMCLKL